MQSKPEVLDEAVAWYEAFYYLSSSRPMGFDGALPIPLTEMDAYCRLTDVAPMDRPAFLRVIRQLDKGFLELRNRTVKTIVQP